MKSFLYLFFLCLLFPFHSLAQSPLSASLDSKQDVNCHSGNNGYAIINASGGMGPYTYQLNLSGQLQSSRTFDQLTAGSYSVRVSDVLFNFVDVDFDILEPDSLALNIVSQQDIDCYGEQTGEVILSASGGTGAYEFAVNGNNYTSSPSFKFLPAGMHSFLYGTRMPVYRIQISFCGPMSLLRLW